jgi:hypothetical protein
MKSLFNLLKTSKRPLGSIKVQRSESLHQLQQSYKTKEIKQEKEEIQLENGISTEFQSANFDILNSLKLKKKAEFIPLVKLCKSPEEQQKLKETAVEWVKSRMFSFKKTRNLIQELYENDLHELLFELLSKKYSFQLHPVQDSIKMLIDSYAFKHIETAIKNDEKAIEWLELTFKYFAILLYYDIPPTLQTYHQLIQAGLYGQTEQGIEWSFMTIREVESLGWTLLPQTKVALIYHLIKKGDYAAALLEASELPEMKQYLLIKIQLLLKLDKLDQAIAFTHKLASFEDVQVEESDYSLQFWKSEIEVLQMVKEASGNRLE